jgi:hypothetical protein
MKKIISIIVFIAALVLGTLAAKAQTIVNGNPTCSDLSLGSIAAYVIQPPQAGINAYSITGIGTVTTNINVAPTNATPSTVSFNASAPFVRAFIVKAGNRANVYTYNPSAVAGVNLLSPIDVNGNFPGISHLDVCYALGTTAANVNITGRIITENGTPIAKAVISTIIPDTGQTVYSLSNQYGYYNLQNLPVGQTYLVVATAKGHTFTPKLVNLIDELSQFDIASD